MSKVKEENFICVLGWMIKTLQLKGNELLLYAIIYGFSQDEENWFEGSHQYLADWTNSTKQGVMKAIKKLLEKEYIEKKETIVNGVKFCSYRATKLTDVINKVNKGGKQSLPGGSKQSLHNNIDLDNTNDINNKNKERKKSAQDNNYQKIIDEKIEDEEIKGLIWDFIKMRQMKKRVLTDRALTIQINKLYRLSKDKETQKAIIEKTIVKAWDEFYPLNDTPPGTPPKENKISSFEYKEQTEEEKQKEEDLNKRALKEFERLGF